MEITVEGLVDPKVSWEAMRFWGTDPRSKLGFSGVAMLREREVIVTELHISSTEGVTANSLRALKVGEIRRQILSEIRDEAAELADAGRRFDRIAPALSTAYEMESEEVPGLKEALKEGLEEEVRHWDAVVRRSDDVVHALRLSSPSRGRGARSDDFYRDIAIRYLHHVNDGEPRPIMALTKELGRYKRFGKPNRNTVSRWVRRSREEGWLSKSTRGKAGGTPGPRLIAWIKENEQNA